MSPSGIWTPGYSPGPLRRVEQRYLLGPGLVRANRALLAFAQQSRPDVVLLRRVAVWPSTVRAPGATGLDNRLS